MHILLIEDDTRLRTVLSEILRDQSYVVDAIHDGKEGLHAALHNKYDCIICDVMLPGMNGTEIIENLRSKNIATPVLMLTALGTTQDKVRGLDSGADDYLTKPFETDELLARVRSLTRRKGEVVTSVLEVGDISLDLDNSILSTEHTSVELSRREFDLLLLLMRRVNNIVSKQSIMQEAWNWDNIISDNNIEVYISFLRKKLTFLKSHVSITTRRGLGYVLTVQEK